MQYQSQSKAITAQNQFSDPIQLEKGGWITLAGTFVANIVAQRLGLDGTTWHSITDNDGVVVMTTAGVYTINPMGIPGTFRVGCLTGGYTSGTANISIEGQ